MSLARPSDPSGSSTKRQPSTAACRSESISTGRKPLALQGMVALHHVIVAVIAVFWVCSSNWLKAMYIIPKRGKVDKVDWNKDLLGVSPCSLSSDVEASNFEAKSLEHGLVAVHTHHQMPMRKLDRGGVRSGWCQCELSKRVDTPLTWNLVIRCN